MKQTAIISLLLTSIVIGTYFYVNSPADNQLLLSFNEWKSQYEIGSDFDHAQNLYRMKIFQQNINQINAHNSLLGRSYDMGVNQFAHLTADQFKSLYLSGYQAGKSYLDIQIKSVVNVQTVDWVAYGAVSPVKNQGSCQATYAFSAVGAIEGISYIKSQNRVQFSVQELIDCSFSYGNHGCSTGLMTNSFNYVIQHGINSWTSYPYAGHQQSCRAGSGSFKNVTAYKNVNYGDCTDLANVLVSQPVSVAVDGRNMAYYRSGVFSNCGTNLDLALLLVGMTDNWWTLKNSWGTAWGESGYIRINRGNACGVCQAGSYPIIDGWHY